MQIRPPSIFTAALLLVVSGGGALAAGMAVSEIGCSLEGLEWQLTQLEGAEIGKGTPEQLPFIRFDEAEKRADGFAGCNRFFGSYELDNEALKFGPLGATRMACPAEQEAVERAFLAALAATTELRLGDTTLRLLAGEKEVAAFRSR